MRSVHSIVACGAASLYFASAAVYAQTTTLTGSSLAYKSQNSATLTQSGYVGTYLTIPSGGATVNLDINATGSGGNVNLVVGNSTYGFTVNGTGQDYQSQNITLPGGTYFVRAERDYGSGSNTTSTINNLSVSTVSGATAGFANDGITTTAASNDAVAAANTYIANYREGAMNLKVIGAPAGTPIEIKEVNSAFKFGTEVPDSFSTYLNNPTYTSILKKDFNSVTPGNGGKWSETSTTSGLNNLDTLLNFAAQNNIRVRGHNLIWGSQQPTNINTDFTNSQSTNTTTAANAKADIANQLSTRIANYVGGNNSISGVARATQYAEMDVYNESYHTGAANNTLSGSNDNYWKVMGAATSGAAYTASVYNAVQATDSAKGGNTELFTNEYNVLNNSMAGDNLAQWYSQHVESIRAAGGAVSGIGTEWYNSASIGSGGSNIDPARAYATWQNLSSQGLPLEVTEFGETAGTAANEATGLTTAMTLAFGMKGMSGFTLWGFYPDGYAPTAGSVLYDSNYNITAAGIAYEALLKSWTTDDTTTVNADGSVTLPGNAFYGDYQAIINGKTYDFTFDPTTDSLVLAVPEPALMGLIGFGAIGLAARRRRAR